MNRTIDSPYYEYEYEISEFVEMKKLKSIEIEIDTTD